VKRRDFITLIGGAVAWPAVVQAQQQSMPVIGFLNPASLDTNADRLRAFHRGLKESGHVDGENVTILYRWGENQTNRLPELAADLVRRRVAVIAMPQALASVLAAKAATTTIPIVFANGDDPVKHGLVASLARPGGNVTGISFLAVELAAKRLELLRELVPTASRIAVMLNPTNPNAETTLRGVEEAARALGLQIHVLNASTSREIVAAFAILERERSDALFVGGDAFFNSRRVQLAHLATRYAVPATYAAREIVEVGGLMSYGSNIADAWRQVGVYTGRILSGAKPAEMPVVQATKFELVINAEAARLLGLTIPPQLLSSADEVIE